jgi:hypothetical protein
MIDDRLRSQRNPVYRVHPTIWLIALRSAPAERSGDGAWGLSRRLARIGRLPKRNRSRCRRIAAALSIQTNAHSPGIIGTELASGSFEPSVWDVSAVPTARRGLPALPPGLKRGAGMDVEPGKGDKKDHDHDQGSRSRKAGAGNAGNNGVILLSQTLFVCAIH